MKYQCDLVQDLLPLYEDSACSKTSRDIVEEHLQECTSCRKMAERMKNSVLEEKLTEEKNTVIREHEKRIRQRTMAIGVVSALVSLILLLLICCIYTHGDWFWVASTACIFGWSVVFAVFVVRELPLGRRLEEHAGCLVLLWDSFWLYLLLIVCGVYVHGGAFYWRTAVSVSTYILIVLWFWFLIIRYWKKHPWTKAGLLVMVTGIWFGLANNVIGIFIPGAESAGLEYLDLAKGFSTSDYNVLNANILFTIIVVSVCVGTVWMWMGYRKGRNNAKEKKN